MSTNDLGTTELQEAAERKHTAVEAKSEDDRVPIETRQAWDRIAPGYDRTNTETQIWLGSEALNRAELRSGMRLLDVQRRAHQPGGAHGRRGSSPLTSLPRCWSCSANARRGKDYQCRPV